jgi:hypothetical protein
MRCLFFNVTIKNKVFHCISFRKLTVKTLFFPFLTNPRIKPGAINESPLSALAFNSFA